KRVHEAGCGGKSNTLFAPAQPLDHEASGGLVPQLAEDKNHGGTAKSIVFMPCGPDYDRSKLDRVFRKAAQDQRGGRADILGALSDKANDAGQELLDGGSALPRDRMLLRRRLQIPAPSSFRVARRHSPNQERNIGSTPVGIMQLCPRDRVEALERHALRLAAQ